MSDKLKSAIADIVDCTPGSARLSNGTFEFELYADYRDEMDGRTAAEICQSPDPELALWEKLAEWYSEAELHEQDELESDVLRKINESGEFPDGIEDDVRDILEGMVCWKYPEEHFLRQEFNVNILLDTGDGNFDFTLNSPYPCWYGNYDTPPDEKGSLLWLARQQGYNKAQLWKALREGDMRDPKGFLQSCRVECANLPSAMAAVTFLVRMTLARLIELNRCVKLQDRNGRFYDATENPDCGYLTLDKTTMCGLFNPWSGGGSVLEVQLERDVKIPIRYIWSALPDGHGHGRYDVGDVYGMCGSAWQDSIVSIEPPDLDRPEAKPA